MQPLGLTSSASLAANYPYTCRIYSKPSPLQCPFNGIRITAQYHIETYHLCTLHISTVASLHCGLCSSMAAFTILAMSIGWIARVGWTHSSTVTELIAIYEGICFCESLPFTPPIAIFTDSRCAVQRIAKYFLPDSLVGNISMFVSQFLQSTNPARVQ